MLVGKATGTGAEFSLLAIVDWQQNAGSLGLNPVMIPALLAILPDLLPARHHGRAALRHPEAETEVLEGPLLEYGGPLLALFQIGSALKTFVVLGLGVALFFPRQHHLRLLDRQPDLVRLQVSGADAACP